MLLLRFLFFAFAAPPLLFGCWREGLRSGFLAMNHGLFFFFVVLAAALAFLVIGRDVRRIEQLQLARERAEASLRESERAARKLAAIVEASSDAILTVDPASRRITFWNEGAERLWGWRKADAVGQPADWPMAPDAQPLVEAVMDTLDRGEPAEIDGLHGFRRDGTPLELSVRAFPVRDERGATFSYAAIQRDITLLERALADVERTRELNRLKDHFLSTVSHEMKTPLALIIGYTELLEDEHANPELLGGIMEGSRRLQEHLDAILDYTALSSGTMPLYKTELDLGELADQAAAIVREGFPHVDLRVDVAPDVPHVCGDSRRVLQIMLEILRNGAKVTPAGKALGLALTAAGNEARIDIWDHGPGIPEEDFQRIWEGFNQLEIGDSERLGGLGLGLGIVKGLVDLHGGRVALVSQLGRGSTFTVYLPALPRVPEAPFRCAE
jgi:PAS domain S-box-containing protein